MTLTAPWLYATALVFGATGGIAVSQAEEAGLVLPQGFKATIFADNLGAARHLTVRDDGTVYVALRNLKDGKGAVALRDTDGDGRADVTTYFGGLKGTGIELHGDWLYFGTDDEIFRFALPAGQMVPDGEPQSVVAGFDKQRSHRSKPFTFDGEGHLYVNNGANANACQEESRSPGSPGKAPCPLLERQAGIYRYAADETSQVHGQDGTRYATGVRNAMGIAWNQTVNKLYFTTHGRDGLGQLWPDIYDLTQSAELPSEEFHVVEAAGDNFGWPYSYWDHAHGERRQSPEYGGDGRETVEDGLYREPLVGFPGHWAPNDLIFYEGTAFPSAYAGGAFIAFHGSWNRAPLRAEGYNVVFVPMKDGKPDGQWSVFADGFKGADPLMSPGDAQYRPMGLAVGPAGALYISDSVKGRVWKVVFDAG